MKKLLEEKEYLEKIRVELEEENRRKLLKKQNLMFDNQQELNKFMNKKKLEEQKNFNEKIENQQSLSLPMHHEERLENYKNMINKLSDKIDINVNSYKQYTNNAQNLNPNNTRFSNRYDQENMHENDNMNYSKYNTFNDKNNYESSNFQPGSNSIKNIYFFNFENK